VLKALLKQVGDLDYDLKGSLSQPIFDVLAEIGNEVAASIPSHFDTKFSKGIGGRPFGLWVAILDPDITNTPTTGTYVVFLFNEARTEVSLSLNQGVTAAVQRAKQSGQSAKQLLRDDAEVVRNLLSADVHDLVTDLHLGNGDLVRKYEAGNIYAKTWSLSDLPEDEVIALELVRFMGLYRDAVVAKDIAVLRGAAQLPARDPKKIPDQPREFKPKNDADYKAHIKSAVQSKSRFHETLVRKFGDWVAERGFEPNTRVHPRDLVLHRDEGPDCLVEVKVFPTGRPLKGTRECIGQLFEYRHFFGTPDVLLVAALSENPGDAYVDLNTSLGIATVWPDQGDRWSGCHLARELNLVD